MQFLLLSHLAICINLFTFVPNFNKSSLFKTLKIWDNWPKPFDEIKKDYPKAKEVFLNTNYRSKQNILDLSYNFIQLNNPDRLEVKLKVANKKLSKKLKSAVTGKGKIEHLHAPTLEDEMAMVINKISELFNNFYELVPCLFAFIFSAHASSF